MYQHKKNITHSPIKYKCYNDIILTYKLNVNNIIYFALHIIFTFCWFCKSYQWIRTFANYIIIIIIIITFRLKYILIIINNNLIRIITRLGRHAIRSPTA